MNYDWLLDIRYLGMIIVESESGTNLETDFLKKSRFLFFDHNINLFLNKKGQPTGRPVDAAKHICVNKSAKHYIYGRMSILSL